MTDDADIICLLARIHGRVQGVFYRAWTQQQAQSLRLTGWARNRRDGTVEALFCGPREAVEEMLRRAHDGPPAARVERVDTREMSQPAPARFEILPTE